jgi:hypothetical protein
MPCGEGCNPDWGLLTDHVFLRTLDTQFQQQLDSALINVSTQYRKCVCSRAHAGKTQQDGCIVCSSMNQVRLLLHQMVLPLPGSGAS